MSRSGGQRTSHIRSALLQGTGLEDSWDATMNETEESGLLGQPGRGVSEFGDGVLGDDAEHLLLAAGVFARDQREPRARLVDCAQNRVELLFGVYDNITSWPPLFCEERFERAVKA